MQEINTIKSLAQNTIDTSPIHEYVGQHALIAETVACELGKDCKAPSGLNPVIIKARFRLNNGSVTLGSVSQVKQCRLSVKEKLGVHWCDSVAVTTHGFLTVCLPKNTIRIYRRQLDGQHKKEASITLSRKITTASPTRCCFCKWQISYSNGGLS